MKILIIGDCHGQFLPVIRAIREARKLYDIGAAIQVGDFGFYDHDIKGLLRTYNGFSIPTYVIDGNHEDHEFISDGLSNLEKFNIFYCPRGSTLELDGAEIGFCGGALNVDRPQEWDKAHEGKWKRQLPEDAKWTSWCTIKNAEYAAEQFNVDPLDLLVTHSCPGRIGVGQQASPYLMEGERQFIRCWGIDPGPVDDVGEPGLIHLWNKLRQKPANWVYGHFHGAKQKQIEGTMFTCVGSADYSDGHHGVLPWIYDTQTKKLELAGNAQRLTGKS